MSDRKPWLGPIIVALALGACSYDHAHAGTTVVSSLKLETCGRCYKVCGQGKIYQREIYYDEEDQYCKPRIKEPRVWSAYGPMRCLENPYAEYPENPWCVGDCRVWSEVFIVLCGTECQPAKLCNAGTYDPTQSSVTIKGCEGTWASNCHCKE